MKALALLLALASVGCAVEAKPAPLVKQGEAIVVLWGFLSTSERETLIVDQVREDGWIVAHNPGDTPWLVNLTQALEVADLATLPRHPAIDQGPREHVRR